MSCHGSFCLPLIWNSGLPRSGCLFLSLVWEVFSLFSFLDPYSVSMLGFAPCPLICLYFSFFISSAALPRWVPLPGTRVHWSFLLFHLVCYLTLLMYFLVHWLYSTAVASIYLVLLFSIFFWSFLCDLFLLNLVSIIMTITWNFLSGTLPTIFLKVFPEILSFSSLWNTFLCFFICLDCLFCFLCIRWNDSFLILEGLGLFKRWTLFFNPVLALVCLTNLFDCLSSLF